MYNDIVGARIPASQQTHTCLNNTCILRRFSITLVSPARAERTCESIRLSVRFGARGHGMEVETFSYAWVFFRMLFQVRFPRAGQIGVMEKHTKLLRMLVRKIRVSYVKMYASGTVAVVLLKDKESSKILRLM